MRLTRWLVSLGYAATRREAASLVRHGRVRVDGAPGEPDAVVAAAQVTVDGEPLDHPSGLLLVMNKPLGVVCSHSDTEGPTVFERLPARWRRRDPAVEAVGRLDKDTAGVLILTDQHALLHRLTSPRHHVEKVYEATLDRDVDEQAIAAFAVGVVLRGEPKPCRPARLEAIGPGLARVVVEEGRYHQVRRMFAAVDRRVVALARTRFGPVGVGDLAPGELRALDLNAFGST